MWNSMKVLIWGAANHGANLAMTVKDGIEVLAFVDNDIDKVGTTYWGYPVIAKEEINNYKFDKIVISISESFDTKKWILENTNTDESNIFESYGSMFSDLRLCALRQISKIIYDNNINGAVAELGVYRGDFAKEINLAFPDRKLYLFDTFEGFNDIDIQHEMNKDIRSLITYDFSNTSIDLIREKMPHVDYCDFRVGYFPDTTAGLEKERFAFVNIDADLFNPIYEGLKFFYKGLSKGGFIMVHDYYNQAYPGAKLAVEQFVRETKAVFVPIQDHAGSIVIGK